MMQIKKISPKNEDTLTQEMGGLSITDLMENNQTVLRALCKKSFYVFFLTFWHIPTNNATFSPNWHIKYICDECERVGKNTFMYVDGDFNHVKIGGRSKKLYDLLVNVPPASSKSTIISVMFPVWCWINDPDLVFITAAFSESLSIDLASKSKDIINHPDFKKLFPEIKLRTDKNSKLEYHITYDKYDVVSGETITHNGGCRITTTPGKSPTGRHADIVIIDDPLKPANAVIQDSAVAATTAEWFKTTIPNRCKDVSVTPFIMVMQRLSENDPSGMWLSEYKKGSRKLKHVCIPAELTPDLRPKQLAQFYTDGILDPKRLGRDILQSFEANMGAYGYAGQYLQSPVPLAGGMFKTQNFYILDQFERCNIRRSVRYWDKANTFGGGCYTAGVLMHLMKDGKFIIEDVVRVQLSADERDRLMKRKAKEDGVAVNIWIEQEPGSGGKESAQSTIAKLAGYIIEADKVSGAKELRADPYASQVNIGNVYLVRGEWNKEFIEEHVYFPNSKYKDQVDAAGGAFNKLFVRKIAGAW